VFVNKLDSNAVQFGFHAILPTLSLHAVQSLRQKRPNRSYAAEDPGRDCILRRGSNYERKQPANRGQNDDELVPKRIF
jgi:hypothetical protein